MPDGWTGIMAMGAGGLYSVAFKFSRILYNKVSCSTVVYTGVVIYHTGTSSDRCTMVYVLYS